MCVLFSCPTLRCSTLRLVTDVRRLADVDRYAPGFRSVEETSSFSSTSSASNRSSAGGARGRRHRYTLDYASDRHYHFQRTARLVLDEAGLPVHLETTGQISDGVPWYERFRLLSVA